MQGGGSQRELGGANERVTGQGGVAGCASSWKEKHQIILRHRKPRRIEDVEGYALTLVSICKSFVFMFTFQVELSTFLELT